MATIDFKDYYKVLDVDRDADEKTLRTAFRKLARKHHPDINPGDPEAEDRFKEINEAYDVLSDPEKRKLFDRYGEEWQRYKEAGFTGDEPAGQQRGQQDFGSWFSGQSQGRQQWTSSGNSSGYSDFFDSVFGDFSSSRSGYSRQPRPQRGHDMDADVEISFDEAFRGTTRRFDIQTQDVCPTCNGLGIVDNHECPTCGGYGTIDKVRSIEVTIPAGVDNGSKVRIAGQGGHGTNGGPNGDVYLNVTVRPDSRFDRDGSNLTTRVNVPLYTAILGGEALVPTPTGQVALTIPKLTQQGKSFRLRGQGMPKLKSKDKARGDLMAKIDVSLPESLTDEETRLFEQLRDGAKGSRS